jgi:hypothetical protein
MDKDIQSKLELFASNAQTVKKRFTWQHALTHRMAALLYAREGLKADCGKIKQCHNLIKENTGVFSTFRGNMVLSLAALLSLSPDPKRLLEDSLKVYSMMKDEKFRASDHLVIAAYEIAAQGDHMRYNDTVMRSRNFYDGMKSNRFFQTGQDDYIYAAMLGLSDLDVATGVGRIEEIYRKLKGEFWDNNSVQALAQILVLGGSDDDTVKRVLTLRDVLRSQKIKLDRAYTLPSLGILAMLPVDINVIVADIDKARKALRAQKGFGSWSIATQELLLFAAAIVAGYYALNMANDSVSAAVSTGIANIIIAQQAAMISVIVASTVVTTTST